MNYEIIFVPDRRLKRISIQLGRNGKYAKSAGQSAVLERRNDGFYELLLHGLEKRRLESYKIFDYTTNPKEVCREVERMFESGEIIAHKTEGRRKPCLIPNNQ